MDSQDNIQLTPRVLRSVIEEATPQIVRGILEEVTPQIVRNIVEEVTPQIVRDIVKGELVEISQTSSDIRTRVTSIETKVGEIEEGVTGIEEGVTAIEERVAGMEMGRIVGRRTYDRGNSHGVAPNVSHRKGNTPQKYHLRDISKKSNARRQV